MSDSERSAAPPGPLLVARLQGLLEMIQPGPVSVDIITLSDLQRRYPLTGLGAPAMRAIEQSQRIVRTVGDYGQVGLCEFHVGLIYLEHQDFHGAAEQFVAARRQWSLADEMTAVCLTYFAEGAALEQALHHEAAMAGYGKALQWLPRIRLSDLPAAARRFVQELQTDVEQAQMRLRELLRYAWPDRPLPESPQAPAGGENGRTTVPPPANSPVPAGDTLHWYQVMQHKGDFLQSVPAQAWLLVDTSIKTFTDGALVVLGSNRDNFTGTIQLRPRTQRLPYRQIYLARLQEDYMPDEFAIVRNVETGEVRFHFPTRDDQLAVVLGLVIGYWLENLRA